ncbi:MAG: site-specific integrase [Streptosporangiaceae bacterium]
MSQTFATASLGYDPAAKRIVKRGSGKTKTEAKAKLKRVLRDAEDGLTLTAGDLTVGQAVNDWLTHGLTSRDPGTITNAAILSRTHIIPALGACKLRDLTARDVDKWLADKAQVLSTSTLRRLHSCLSRSLTRAMARDQVRRNVADLCSVPKGQPGRPSKALTLRQAEAVLATAEASRMHAYVVVSLLTGARTEELRALTWDHVNLHGEPDAIPPVPPHVAVWRSVRG